MDNNEIADQLQLLSRLMDIHGEDSFKAKTYASAAFAIENLPQSIIEMPSEKIFKIKGVGEGIGKKVIEIIETGELQILKDIVAQTPDGIFEMMNIKGLGPKKIHLLWKELHISDIDSLKEACQQNKLSEKKGFGVKTQQNILEAIQFQKQNTGNYLYAQIEGFVEAIELKIKKKFPKEQLHITGSFRRQLEVIDQLEWVTTISLADLKDYFNEDSFSVLSESSDTIVFAMSDALKLKFFVSTDNNFYKLLFNTSSSDAFVLSFKSIKKAQVDKIFNSEEEICSSAGLPFIPPYLREKPEVFQKIKEQNVPDVIETNQIKGLIHAHSNWSDGAHTIEKMAEELIEAGFEYLVISDHSKAAYYAGGLNEERIQQQHKYIDELNEKLQPFKIFKSIECDILNDGAMDYKNAVLATFDLVIASIHSNLQMNEEKAMKRLLGAITNPYVTIMGHLTGRRLLKRKGYPIDHKTIIDACADNHVAIEINANPQRLDMSWEWVDYALEKGVMISINPDAHTIGEFKNIKYGVLVAQKAGLTKEKNLSSFSKQQFENFLLENRKLKGIK